MAKDEKTRAIKAGRYNVAGHDSRGYAIFRSFQSRLYNDGKIRIFRAVSRQGKRN